MSGRVAGKVAFTSGAAHGQGRAHAVRLAQEGADIIAFDVCGPVETQGAPPASEDDLAETVALVEKQGRRIVAAKADARDFDAGIQGIAATAAESREGDCRAVPDTNLTAVWNTARAWVHPEGGQRLAPGFGPIWAEIILESISVWGIDTSAYEPPNSRKVVTP